VVGALSEQNAVVLGVATVQDAHCMPFWLDSQHVAVSEILELIGDNDASSRTRCGSSIALEH
jgi:hypothetical protein